MGHLLVRPDSRLRVTGYYGLVISGLAPGDSGLYRSVVSGMVTIIIRCAGAQWTTRAMCSMSSTR